MADKKPKSKAKASGKGKRKAEPADSGPEDEVSKAPKITEKQKALAEKAAKATERIEVTLTTAAKTKELLAELTPEAIWKSLIRSNEFDRRLAKASGAEVNLQKVQANEKAGQTQRDRANQLQDDITSMVSNLQAMKDVCMLIRGEPSELAEEVAHGTDLFEKVKRCEKFLLSDFTVVIDMGLALAKKLLEASWSQRKI